MPTMRFAKRLKEYFNIRVKTLIKIGTTNIIDITNSNPGVIFIDEALAR